MMLLKKYAMKSLLLIGVVILFSGCISKKIVPIDKTISQNLPNKTFTFVNRELPIKPYVMTPVTVVSMGLFGGIGGAIIGLADNFSSTENVYTKTPEYYLNATLSSYLQKKYKIKYISQDIVTNETAVEDLVKQYSNVDYLIDNRNFKWIVDYYPFNWGTYGVQYASALQFIDVKNKKVIAQGYCDFSSKLNEASPTYDELFKNNNELLKQITKNAIDECVDKYMKEVF